jgi:hypothetical protein
MSRAIALRCKQFAPAGNPVACPGHRLRAQLMKTRRILQFFCLLPTIAFAQPEHATPEEIQERVADVFARHTMVVKGSENPVGIPLAVKLDGFFRRLAKESSECEGA